MIKFTTEPKEMSSKFQVKDGNAVYLMESLERSSNINMTVNLVSDSSDKIIHRSFVYIYVSEKNESELQQELAKERTKS